MTPQQFQTFLERSHALHAAIADAVADLPPCAGNRFAVARQSGLLSIEHGVAAHALVAANFAAPGITLLRAQFETLVRGIWLIYAATDSWIDKLSGPLTADAAESGKDAPMLAKMLAALDNCPTMPRALLAQLTAYRDVTWKALNSYAHGGIHPLARSVSGYPLQLCRDVLRNANALCVLAAQLCVIASGHRQAMEAIRAMHRDFLDVLPVIEAPEKNPPPGHS